MTINHTKIGTGILVVGGLVSLLLFYRLVAEIENRTWKLQSPVVVSHKVSVGLVKTAEALDPYEGLDEMQRYICIKFGKDCATALSIVDAENGLWTCDRISAPNSNGTIDRGLWQLNSRYHPFISDCYKNTDRAYEVYTAWKGFEAWSTYNSGKYKKYISKYEKYTLSARNP